MRISRKLVILLEISVQLQKSNLMKVELFYSERASKYLA